MAGNNIQDLTDEVLRAVTTHNKQLAASSDVVMSINNQQEAERLIMVEAAKGGGMGFATGDGTRQSLAAIEQRKRADLLAQEQTLKAATAVGANMADAGELVTARLATLSRSVDQTTKDTQVVRDKLETRFLDAPVDWVLNQFTIGGDIKRAEASRAQVASQAAGILNINQSLQTTAVTNNNNKRVITEATIAADMEANAKYLAAQAAERNHGLLGTGLGTIEALTRMSAQQVDNLSKAQSAAIGSEQYKMAQKQFELQTKNINSEIDARDWKMSIEKADRSALEELGQSIRDGAKVSENIDLNPKMFSTPKLMQLLYAKYPDTLRWLQAGIKYQANGHVVLGDGTVAGAVKDVMDFKGPGQPAAAPIIDLYKKTVRQVSMTPATDLAAHGVNPAKKEDVYRFAGSLAAKAAGSMGKDISFGPDGYAGNIYAPPPLATVAADDGKWFAAIKASPLWQQVIEPQFKAGGLVENNPRVLVASGIAAVKAGKITSNDFDTGMATYFQSMKIYNNGTKFYQGYGLPSQDGFPTTIATGLLGGDEVYDFTKQMDITRMRLKFGLGSLLTPSLPGVMEAGFDVLIPPTGK